MVCSLAPALPSVHWLICAQHMASASRRKELSPGGIPEAAGRDLHSSVHSDNADEHSTKGTSLQLLLGPVQCHPPDSHWHLGSAHQAAGLPHSTELQALKMEQKNTKNVSAVMWGSLRHSVLVGQGCSLVPPTKPTKEELCRGFVSNRAF